MKVPRTASPSVVPDPSSAPDQDQRLTRLVLALGYPGVVAGTVLGLASFRADVGISEAWPVAMVTFIMVCAL